MKFTTAQRKLLQDASDMEMGMCDIPEFCTDFEACISRMSPGDASAAMQTVYDALCAAKAKEAELELLIATVVDLADSLVNP